MSHRARPVGPLLATTALAAATAMTAMAQSGLPEAGAEPTTSTTAPSGSSSAYPSDGQGYTDSAARCDEGQTLMAFGRTSRALVTICVGPDGQLEYRGVRLSDNSSLTVSAGRASDGSIVATNEGVTYAVSPEMLLVSDGDTVLYRDSWVEFREPGFSGASSTPETSSEESSSAETSSAETSSPGTPTVSTTTVTVTATTSTPAG
ncbi:hypothetical protein [Mycolicibacterium sp.]|uniref:hypothetical protein n=1 Tax=Mycolicibacterium sp. TaxID=2320850 RepID=UPI001D5418E5|nr:hypothetical protein [Mycolicibacterium sp.]MCB1290402.1 hypothetical protein [Mycobacterium sp.]MCB9407979.1 hypothetical protein [Mycolicibacterium sp.]